MSKKSKTLKIDLLTEVIVDGILEVKGDEILELDLRALDVSICDKFIICHGNSTTQVDAIAKKVQEFTQKNLNEKPWKTSGFENSEWIILDYFSIVVHIFQKDVRYIYDLEELWSDSKITNHSEAMESK